MITVRINDATDIAKKIIGDYKTINYVSVVGYYDTIMPIFNYLIKHTDSEFVQGMLYPYEYDEYEDAYILEYDKEEIWLSRFDHTMIDADIKYVEEDFLEEFAERNVVDDTAVIFGYKDVDDKINTNIYMDDDNMGFTFCVYDEYGCTKFTYRGVNKLSEDDVWDIITNHFS